LKDQERFRTDRNSRRDFLKKSLIATGCLAFPSIVPSSVFGSNAPSNRITLGFIGLGKQGIGSHLRTSLRYETLQVLAICDVDTQAIDYAFTHVKDAYGDGASACDKYTDFRDLLARDDIDAVYISTPDHWHALTCIAAAKAGKDIYCEKPLGHSIREGRAIADAVRKYNCVFQTGSQQRLDYAGRFRLAAELIRSGRIGKLHTIYVQVGGPAGATYLDPEPIPQNLNWNMWLGPAPMRPYSSVLAPAYTYGGFPHWRYYEDFGGGGLFDFGAHHFDIAQWAMDVDRSGPSEIIPPGFEGNDKLMFKYSSGVVVYHNGGAGACDFRGTEGRIIVDRGFISSDPPTILKDPIGADDVHLGRGLGHREDWWHCIRTRETPVADAEIGHRTSSVCDLARIAYRLKRPLKWNPNTERFVNDPEANRLTGYPMRAPWPPAAGVRAWWATTSRRRSMPSII